ncbi:PRD domain-containing protein [Alicyclobacillus herbarius]|uniref:PRD domain-containing protein n=1 Tax=Alicyclobacillus herbarius TaxID=122960 RepID=UPI00047BDAA1|nr:PRD domain-containing protein [Alicyclobacillus herbarius]
MSECIVQRVLNNNVVIVEGTAGEQILIGRGIGFGVKRGTRMDADDARVEKRFVLLGPDNRLQFERVMSRLKPEVAEVAEAIITLAEDRLPGPLNERIHIALADHIGLAIERLRAGLEVENPFVEEIQTLYPDAWRVAESAAAMMTCRLGVQVPQAEIGFLALHLQAAAQPGGSSDVARTAIVVRSAVEQLEAWVGPFDRTGLEYARLVSHLRFAVQRVLRGELVANPLLDAIMERLPKSYAKAQELAQLLERKIGKPFPSDEIASLAMVLARFVGER